MSRGFVKEDDQEENPMVPPRAHLPDGVPNFVTPEGRELLLAEREVLINERNNLSITNEKEKRIASNFINAKLLLLEKRIAAAQVVKPDEQPQDEVRFGATITFRSGSSANIHTFRIVGVDEADISRGKVSFLSPVAKVLMNKKAGDRITLKQDGKDIVFEIISITY